MYPIQVIIDNKYIVYEHILGEGISKIYLGKNIKSNENVAIKKILHTETNAKLIKNEISCLKNTDHPNIIKLHDNIHYKEFVYLIFEYCEGGDLYKYKKFKNEDDIKNIYIQIAKGLVYLNKKNIYHHDIKPHNILIKNNILKICDFGFVNNFDLICGSPIYMAPELFKYKRYSKKSDIWSLGIIIYEMLNEILPYNLNKCKNIKDIITSVKPPLEFNQNKNISCDAMNLLIKMLEIDYEKRIGWDDLLDNDWVNTKISMYPDSYILNTAIYSNYFSFTNKFEKKTKPSKPKAIFKSNSDKSTKFKYIFLKSL